MPILNSIPVLWVFQFQFFLRPFDEGVPSSFAFPKFLLIKERRNIEFTFGWANFQGSHFTSGNASEIARDGDRECSFSKGLPPAFSNWCWVILYLDMKIVKEMKVNHSWGNCRPCFSANIWRNFLCTLMGFQWSKGDGWICHGSRTWWVNEHSQRGRGHWFPWFLYTKRIWEQRHPRKEPKKGILGACNSQRDKRFHSLLFSGVTDANINCKCICWTVTVER